MKDGGSHWGDDLLFPPLSSQSAVSLLIVQRKRFFTILAFQRSKTINISPSLLSSPLLSSPPISEISEKENKIIVISWVEEFFSLSWSSIKWQYKLFGFSLCFCYFLSLSIFVAFDQLRLYCWGDSSVALFAFMILNYVLRYIIIIVTVYKVTFLLLLVRITEFFYI